MADEEDASSSQEFDEIEETSVPEAPRSVCASEGPASLGDFDSEGNALRNLTEICAEMRSASEPAFDNVPDDNIRDVKEHKSLCVEAVTMNAADNAIDYEREGAFRDIPTNLSLCVEPGEIPSSPMTQARENSWIKRSGERKETNEIQEKSFANAKYVVSYDEESVTLMENQLVTELKTHEQASLPKESSKRSIKLNSAITRATKRAGATTQPQFTLHEHEDSIVIEDTRAPVRGKISKSQLAKKNDKKGQSQIDKTLKIVANVGITVEPTNENSDQMEAMIVEGKPDQSDSTDTFVQLQAVDAIVDKDVHYQELPEPMEATMAPGLASLPLDLPVLDEDYHIVEPIILRKDTAAYSQQSDDDIEHIQSCDVILELVDTKMEARCADTIEEYEISPIRQRKSSKSTISDDDLEHINTSELSELFERAKSLVMDNKNDVLERPEVLELPGKTGLSSDDDIEHLSHPELPEIDQTSLGIPPLLPSTPEPLPSIDTSTKKSQKCGTVDRNTSVRPTRTSRKRKDVVVIDSDSSTVAAEVTVIVKSHEPAETWNKSKSPEKDLTEEIDRCVEPKDRHVDPVATQSLPKKTRVRSKGNSNLQKTTSSSLIEIIDIDAMQKAEMEIASGILVPPVPECKIFESCQEIPIARMKKSRRNRDINPENNSDNTKISPSKQNIADPPERSTKVINWPSVATKTDIDELNTQIKVDEPCLETKIVQKPTLQELKAQISIPEVKLSKKRGKKSTNIEPPCTSATAVETAINAETLDLKTSPSVEKQKSPEKHISCAETCEMTTKKVITRGNEENTVSNVEEKNSSVDDKKIEKTLELNVEEAAPERSSSSDDLNANVVPMDTEEDGGVREVIEKNNSITASPSWSTVGKKNNRSKKKKRR